MPRSGWPAGMPVGDCLDYGSQCGKNPGHSGWQCSLDCMRVKKASWPLSMHAIILSALNHACDEASCFRSLPPWLLCFDRTEVKWTLSPGHISGLPLTTMRQPNSHVSTSRREWIAIFFVFPAPSPRPGCSFSYSSLGATKIFKGCWETVRSTQPNPRICPKTRKYFKAVFTKHPKICHFK